MTIELTATSPPAAAWETWIAVFALRLEQVRWAIPSNLSGVVQFEIEQDDHGTAWFTVRLAGANTAIEHGRADGIDTLVRTSEAALRGLLEAEGEPAPVLEAWGRAELVTRFFDALSTTPAAKNFISIRSKKK
jgi:hypothetical protein